MELDLAFDALVNGGSGVFDVLLGVAVLSIRPVRPVQRLFGIFGILFGLSWFITNLLLPIEPVGFWLWILSGPFQVVAGVALALLALRIPVPLPSDQRSLMVGALVVGSLRVLGTLLVVFNPQDVFSAAGGVPLGSSADTARLVYVTVASRGLLLACYLGALTLLALRFPVAAPEDRRALGLTSAALVLYPSSALAGVLLNRAYTHTPIPPSTLFYVAPLAILVVLWLRNTTVGGADGRLARNVALLTLAPMVVGALLYDPTSRLGGPQNGIFRTLGVLVLAYGILRHRLLDIDLKVRWTIKNSTVAAVFVGVFFVVSNLVQTFFQSTLGPYVGIAAAGLLVFAMAPLQHFAERVASAAMPGVRSTEQLSHPERALLYRDLARQAWSDGHLTADERDLLETARTRLGLSRDEAASLEQEVSRGEKVPAG